MIGEQSQHLQRQANELAAMRATPEERKLLDQAKNWLMQQHGLSEEKGLADAAQKRDGSKQTAAGNRPGDRDGRGQREALTRKG
ncbi:ANTAR domain-containing protein [Pantoea ananatis]